jgi:5-phospho-D-xylono-1,4-lactonase
MAAKAITTVLGPRPQEDWGITDAHNHLWIDPVPGGAEDAPVLNEMDPIVAELVAFRDSGGYGVLDCQPGGCGRNGKRLVQLASTSGVAIVAATGFHRRRYYPPDHWLWSVSAGKAADHFTEELENGLTECQPEEQPARAGFIKIACEAYFPQTPQAALLGAVHAAVQTGAMLAIHTEKGLAAEMILPFVLENGVKPHQIVLCHMDKRPDRELHLELAQAGVLLEYDTFYRPYYQPEKNLWPLLDFMMAAGYSQSIALATDMADRNLWRSFTNGPGLVGFTTTIRSRLEQLGASPEIVRRLLGQNITQRLANTTLIEETL